MSQNKDFLREQRLESIECVRHLDKIGTDGSQCRFLVYLDVKDPVYFGTDNTKINTNDIIEHIIMRSEGITKVEAIHRAIKTQPTLIAEDFETCISLQYYYAIIH